MLLAVLTISDRCSQGLMQDTAGPAASLLLAKQWPQAQIENLILSDDISAIAAALTNFCKQSAQLILTIGGTGFGSRDHTPEATRQVIEREAPGLAELMRQRGAEHSSHAWLSRSVAGIKGSTLILNLPGSLRAAEESLAAVLPLLPHALEVLSGTEKHM